MNERAVLLAILVALGAGWGITQPLAKIAVSEGYRHFGIIFWQQAITAVALSLVLLAQRRPLPAIGRRQMGFFALIAVIGTILPNTASYQAAVHLPAGILAILLSLVPMFAFPVALGFGVDRFGWGRLAGLGLGAAGVLLIVAPAAGLPDPAMAAFVPLALVAPLCYAFEGNIVQRWGTAGLDAIQVLAGASAMSVAISLPLALIRSELVAPAWGAPTSS